MQYLRTWVLGFAVVVSLGSVVHAASVRLAWDVPDQGVPAGYTLYRRVVPGGLCTTTVQTNFELLGVAPLGVQPTFTDAAPVVGANYYHVTAYNSEGESLPSNQVCFQGVQVSGPPKNLRIL